ncbi:MAG: 50S ribosomal protein L11 methyltransferase, partial [Deltaproteobacteria bacterium]|nr:50S ribosomal protein L11 methyltransferase [Deltaproteobacteria bacterium]
MSYTLVVTAPEDELEVLAAELFALGAEGVELQDHEIMLMPGTPPLPDGGGRAIAHFESKEDAVEAREALLEALPQLELPQPLEVAPQDWSTAWRAHHKAMKVGPRAWVHPPWEEPKLADGELAIAIDPGMAFGTGSHPTTSLCLERTDELLKERPGADVLDVGTGSGVIAILAARLHAGRVCGTENDPIALTAAKEGAHLNGLHEDRIQWRLANCDDLEGALSAPYAIVIANILLNTLVELAPQIARKVAPGGVLVLSG